MALGVAVATCGTDAPTAGASLLFFAAQPVNAVAGANLGSIRVEARDASGNVVRSFTGNVTITITTGSGTPGATLSGTITVSAVDGTATFSNLSIDRTGLGYTLTATTTSLTPATSTPFDISAGPLSALAFNVQPSQFTAGGTINPAVQVTARDALGNTVASFTGNVTMSIGTNPAGGVLGGTTSVAAISGVATFSNLSIDRSGSGYTLAASTAGPPAVGVTSAAFNVLAGPASQLVFSTLPGNAVAGQPLSPAVVVTARDALGNTATGFNANVTMGFGTNPGGATLGGTTTVTAVSGVATFSNLTVNRTGTGYTLVATAGALSTPASGPFDIAPGAASQLAFVQQPTTTTAGGTITPAVDVAAQDAQGNVVPSFTGSITLSIGTNPGSGTLSGTTTVGATAGVASFSSLSINRSGVGYTLVAAATGLANGTSANFDITSGPPTQLDFAVQPSSAVAGTAISPAVVVTARDALGNVATSFTGNVTVAIGTNPAGGTLSGTTTVAAVSGAATFGTLAIDRVGVGYTLTATTGGFPSATSSAFDITAGAATLLEFTVQPSTSVAGTSITPAVVVTARDAQGNTATGFSGNVTVAIGANPGSGVLSGTTTVAASGGVASFSTLSIDRTGVGYTLTAASGGLTGATSSAFDITAGSGSVLVFTVQPSNAGAGAIIAPAIEVTARDAAGNVATGFTGDVTVAIGTNPGGGTLSGTTTVGAVNGVATFSTLSINRSGVGYTLTAAATGLTGVTSQTFDISAGAATQLVFTVQPTSIAAGGTITPAVQVTARDALGNTAPTFVGDVTVAIAANPGGGVLSGTLTATAVAGVVSFGDLSIDKSGVGYTLGATATGLTGATSAAFNVDAGPATSIVFTVEPGTVAAGVAISPAVVVTARDALGNTASAFTGDVTVAIGTNPSGGTLSGTTTVAASSGVATFADLSIDRVGTGYTLTAAATGLPGITSAAFDVVAGAATELIFTVSPATTTAGVAFSPALEVTARDAVGNVATGFTGNVTVAIGTNPGGGTLSGTTTVAATAGVASFPGLSINRSGVGYTLTASSGALTPATSGAFDINPGAATTLAFTVQPSTVTAGSSISPAVAVAAQDALGNTVPSFTSDVTIAIGTNPSGGTLSGTTTVAAAAGVASFGNLSIDRSGVGYTLLATTGGLTDATSAAFTVNAGAATTLVVTTEPTNTVAGAAITPAVQIAARDALGNTDPTFTGTVALAIGTNPSGGALSGTTAKAAVAGVASFDDLSINRAGVGYTLTATSVPLAGATTAAFDITPGAATKLAFAVGPSNATAGVAIAPTIQVEARDALDNVVPSFTGSVTIGFGVNPGSGVLSGTNPKNAVGGIASFSDLSIDKSGVGYTLTASAGGLTGATSAAFDIAAAAATALVVTTQPSNAVAGVAIAPAIVVHARDPFGNTDPTFTGNVTMAIQTNPGAGVLSGTAVRAAVAGVATFNDLSINRTGNGYTLTASAASLTSVTTAAFNITPGAATKLAFTVGPSNAVAGVAIAPSIQVQAQDALDNLVTTFTGSVSLGFGANPGAGVLSGTTPRNAVGGVATFNDISINKAGVGYTLTAAATGLTAGTSAAFDITAAAATQLVMVVPPVNTAAGASITPAVQVHAQDPFGNTNTTYTGNVTVAIANNPSAGVLSGTLTRAAVAGIATFNNLSIDKTGVGYTLGATSVPALTAVTSGPFNITPGAATTLVFTVSPNNTTVNTIFSPALEVTARDALGNVATQFVGNVTMAIGTNPGGGTLGGTLTKAAVNGVANFSNLNINAVGNGYTLVASSSGLTAATSAPFNITPSVATQLVFTAQPGATVAGAAIATIQVTARDASGSAVTSFTDPVTVMITPGTGTAGAILSGTTTQSAVGGVATFNGLSIDKTGSYKLTATATGLTDGLSAFFAINPGAPATLEFTVPPSNAVVNTAITPQIQVTQRDALNNVVTNSTTSVTLSITPGTGTGGAVLSGTTTVAPVNGISAFSGLSIDLAGVAYTLTASATGVPSVASGTFDITAAAGNRLSFSVQPTNAIAGATISPAVQVSMLLNGGGLDNTFNGAVTVAIKSGTGTGGAVLSGTRTVNAVNGVATFNDLSIDKSGFGYRLSATASGAAGAESNSFAIVAAPATRLDVLAQPVTTTAGQTMPAITVRALDQFGNTDPAFVGNVTFTISANPGGGTLSGTTTVAAVAGVATFNDLSINRSGTGYRLLATATGLTSDESNAFSILGGAATSLAFTVQPTTANANQAITPQIRVTAFDALGNVATFTGNITLGITPGTGTAGAVLSGTTTVAAVSGVSSFPGLSINLAGTNYTLTASSAGLPSVASTAFNIN